MIKDLEAALGYKFHNITLLQNALTHSSYANERWHNSLLSNERLEFLGDSILGNTYHLYLRPGIDIIEAAGKECRGDLRVKRNMGNT